MTHPPIHRGRSRAGCVFAIWGVIDVLLGAFTTWQALPRNREGGVLLTGTAIAATFVCRFRDVAYGPVIAWAYIGVAIEDQGTTAVVVAAGLGAAVVGILAVVAFAEGRTGDAARRVGATAGA